MRLWDGREVAADGSSSLTLAEYEGAGSAAQALNDHADEVWSLLSSERQALSGLVFRALTEAGESRDPRRRVRVSALSGVTGSAVEEVRAVAEHFLAADFLTSPDRGRSDDW